MHTHSTRSDGVLGPGELVRLAGERGVAGLALTDHDTVGGVAEAAAVAGEVGVEFLAGIEVSCEFPRPGTLHVLGYGVDPADERLLAMVGELEGQREERIELIHPSHSEEMAGRLRRLADREGLLPVGGSDFHGEGRSGGRLGMPGREVPGEWWEGVVGRVRRGGE